MPKNGKKTPKAGFELSSYPVKKITDTGSMVLRYIATTENLDLSIKFPFEGAGLTANLPIKGQLKETSLASLCDLETSPEPSIGARRYVEKITSDAGDVVGMAHCLEITVPPHLVNLFFIRKLQEAFAQIKEQAGAAALAAEGDPRFKVYAILQESVDGGLIDILRFAFSDPESFIVDFEIGCDRFVFPSLISYAVFQKKWKVANLLTHLLPRRDLELPAHLHMIEGRIKPIWMLKKDVDGNQVGVCTSPFICMVADLANVKAQLGEDFGVFCLSMGTTPEIIEALSAEPDKVDCLELRAEAGESKDTLLKRFYGGYLPFLIENLRPDFLALKEVQAHISYLIMQEEEPALLLLDLAKGLGPRVGVDLLKRLMQEGMESVEMAKVLACYNCLRELAKEPLFDGGLSCEADTTILSFWSAREKELANVKSRVATLDTKCRGLLGSLVDIDRRLREVNAAKEALEKRLKEEQDKLAAANGKLLAASETSSMAVAATKSGRGRGRRRNGGKPASPVIKELQEQLAAKVDEVKRWQADYQIAQADLVKVKEQLTEALRGLEALKDDYGVLLTRNKSLETAGLTVEDRRSALVRLDELMQVRLAANAQVIEALRQRAALVASPAEAAKTVDLSLGWGNAAIELLADYALELTAGEWPVAFRHNIKVLRHAVVDSEVEGLETIKLTRLQSNGFWVLLCEIRDSQLQAKPDADVSELARLIEALPEAGHLARSSTPVATLGAAGASAAKLELEPGVAAGGLG